MSRNFAVIAGFLGLALFITAAYLAAQNPDAGPAPASLASEPPRTEAPIPDNHTRSAPGEQGSATRPDWDDGKAEPGNSRQPPSRN